MRQRRPDLHNFRDFGMTVDRAYLRLVENLQKRHGWAYGSDDAHRAMIEQDTGHLPGVGTLYAARVRFESRGQLESRWVRRGAMLPDGSIARVGCLQLRVPHSSAERRTVAHRALTLNRRRDVVERLMPMPAKLAAVVSAMTRGASSPPAPPSDRDRIERGRLRNLALLAEWRAQHGDDADN